MLQQHKATRHMTFPVIPNGSPPKSRASLGQHWVLPVDGGLKPRNQWMGEEVAEFEANKL